MAHACSSSLLQLPDPCLLAVLQCLAGDPAGLFSAARAHSKLHQAAVTVLRDISIEHKTQQQLDESLLPYLGKHGQHVSSIKVHGMWHSTVLRQLTPNLKVTSLDFYGFNLQLGPGNGLQGVLGCVGASLKQLLLLSCTLLDGEQGLAAALSLLPGLEHLNVSSRYSMGVQHRFPAAVLQHLQQLTYLELSCGLLQHSSSDPQPLKALTRLADLRLRKAQDPVTAGFLSGLGLLTHLHISGSAVEPGALAGKTRLQELGFTGIAGGAADVAELMCQLQHMQQLSYVHLQRCWTPQAVQCSTTALLQQPSQP
jgi:hypothetical protein